VHFGLGDAAKVDGVEIHWPDGVVEKVSGVVVDQIYTVEEGKGITGVLLRDKPCGQLMQHCGPV
jgi:hypothetical protein